MKDKFSLTLVRLAIFLKSFLHVCIKKYITLQYYKTQKKYDKITLAPSPPPPTFFFLPRDHLLFLLDSLYTVITVWKPGAAYSSLISLLFSLLFVSFFIIITICFLNYQILHTNFNHTNRAMNQRDKSLSVISRLLLIRYFYIRVPLPGSLLRSFSSLGNEVKQTTFSSSNLVE